jgi:hypothetical protein
VRNVHRYGVLVDYHAGREHSGVPTWWDGWYSDKSGAVAALRLMKQKHPRANVTLVVEVEEP